MRILPRYVLREFLTPVFYCLVAFAPLHLVFELFGEFDKIIAAHPSLGIVGRYICGHIAKDLQWLVTPSLMLGGLYSMWQLARPGEITAMRANGIGFAAITAPIMKAAVVFALVLLAVGEFYVPRAIHDAEAIKNAGFASGPSEVLKDVHFNNVVGRRDWRAGFPLSCPLAGLRLHRRRPCFPQSWLRIRPRALLRLLRHPGRPPSPGRRTRPSRGGRRFPSCPRESRVDSLIIVGLWNCENMGLWNCPIPEQFAC